MNDIYFYSVATDNRQELGIAKVALYSTFLSVIIEQFLWKIIIVNQETIDLKF